MKAAVWHGTKDVRIEQVDVREVQPGEVKVKVEWAGICGSDLHAYHHGMGVQVGGPHPLTGEQAPLTLGHEFAGTIAELGEGVSQYQVGDRVAIEPLIYCGECKYCREGHYNLCEKFGFIGLNANGGFAEYVVVKKHMLHKLPDQVTLEEGALIEPTAVAFQAVRSSKIKVGDNVAVFGAGPIGLLTILCAKAAGAAQIIAVDISPERLEKAKEVGATAVINAAEADTVKEIMALTGDGVAISYEAAGAQPTFTNAVMALKKGGECMVIAAFAKPAQLDMTSLLVKEINVTASLAYRHVFPEVISLVEQGALDVKKVITKKIKLDQIVEDGLELLVQDKSQAKILVQIQS
ncbi:alcohol dehydrogenase catalytic domain-containing protein [Paenibacillus sp. HJL G12]|uniref:Alcohol dehydrogenase catalytic domain-containing protein n=1 Tax=Paenibacillus dendrobii TaxID=2691084 RepID=A0A7X3IPI3_9BACL|nr:2,3-butanediol dehydrogenase [Paenibacillus dendrobii]MWV45872.1 alcohol dehydrogenase catalytic domain-containing protein [Paenibacillus dendrobii]